MLGAPTQNGFCAEQPLGVRQLHFREGPRCEAATHVSQQVGQKELQINFEMPMAQVPGGIVVEQLHDSARLLPVQFLSPFVVPLLT